MSRKNLSKVSLVTGSISILMFVGVLLITIINDNLANNKPFGFIYFGMFLLFVYIANLTATKSSVKLSQEDERDEKLREIGIK